MRNWLRMGVAGMVMMGAVPVEAIEIYLLPDECSKTTAFPNRHKVLCSEQAFTALLERQAEYRDCLARMEEAMKAVDPWIGETSVHDTDKGVAYRKAKALWNEVKRDCWSTPTK